MSKALVLEFKFDGSRGSFGSWRDWNVVWPRGSRVLKASSATAADVVGLVRRELGTMEGRFRMNLKKALHSGPFLEELKKT